MTHRLHIALTTYLALLFSACSMTKGLKEGELLHDKTQIEIINPDKVNKPGRVKEALAALARPVPASGVGKWQVGIYFAVNKKGKEKGIGAWVQRKFGRPPALYNDRLPEQSRALMEKYLQDRGYFGATVALDTVTKGKKVTVSYGLTSQGQYFIREIFRPADTSTLAALLAQQESETLLKKNRPYDLSLLSAERVRLASFANDRGYFTLTKDHFFYFVDTTAGPLLADLHLRLKPPDGKNEHPIYFLGDVWAYPDYSLEQDTTLQVPDTLRVGSLNIVQKEPVLRPEVLTRLIWQREGAVFSKKEQAATISRLMALGIYKFVNLRFESSVRQDTQRLDRHIYLTPGLMHDLELELQVNSRSGNFLGTELSGSFTHKNLWKGAEMFSLSLNAGVETNIGANAGTILNTLAVGANASLGLPGIHAPFFNMKKISGSTLPRTLFNLGNEFQQRAGFFTVNSFNLSAGYNWQWGEASHQASPLFISLVNTLKTSEKLDALLTQNRRLRSSFENVLIAGLSYKVSYSNQSKSTKGSYFFWRGSIEPAGNLLALASDLTNGSDRVAGIRFSQYLKLDNDLRQYFPLRKGLLAGRFNLGLGYPYGNAEVLPYIKQYFIGGAGSIRAFRIRTLGPGSFETKLTEDGSNFVDQTGDLKLELNVEYRFPIFSYLKGAVFADAGNIWLLRGDADESTPEVEGLFTWSKFPKEIAAGTGFGVRLDFEVAVIRLDWAFPLRKPSRQEGERWLFSEIDFLKKSWRRDNIVWNIAIGYPF